jgi:Tfp pilus assembly protein PilP
LDLKTAQNQQPPNSMQASSDDADNDADDLSQDHPAKEAESSVPAMNSVLKVEDIVEQGERYQYSGHDKPDPFLAPIQLVEAKKQVLDSEEIPIISPLQYFDVKALQTKGVWEAEAGNWKAMIETPDQQGIITKLGDPIGNSGGRVIQVSTNGVLVREYKLQKDGTQAFSERLVPMAKDSNVDEQFLGGKIILTPGASTPIVEKPEDPTSLIPPGQKSSQSGGDTLKASDRLLIEEWIKKSEIASKKDNEGQQRDSGEDAEAQKAKDVQVSPASLDTSKASEGISNSGGGAK